MSKQTSPLNHALPVAQNEPCCTPLVREPLTESWAGDLARMFRALGDPVRLQLLSRVASHAGGEACVCDLSVGLDLSQPTISHHLKVLREAGLLECERRGTWVYYWVVPSALAQLSAVLGSTDVHTDQLGTAQLGTAAPAVLA
jgi:ArsR family transcriptional regulator, arsenate/arsenite/antimonite-responsive transcriptional repressor